jgi:CRISPR-associated protein Cas2
MKVLVTYDVSTIDPKGQKRLSRIAKTLLDYGLRVQNSVFECEIDSSQWQILKNNLLEIFDKEQDSLRFYYLGSKFEDKIEHHGVKKNIDLKEALLF